MKDHFITIGSQRYSSKLLSSQLETEILTLNKRIDYFRELIDKDAEILQQFKDMVNERQNILDWLNREVIAE